MISVPEYFESTPAPVLSLLSMRDTIYAHVTSSNVDDSRYDVVIGVASSRYYAYLSCHLLTVLIIIRFYCTHLGYLMKQNVLY